MKLHTTHNTDSANTSAATSGSQSSWWDDKALSHLMVRTTSIEELDLGLLSLSDDEPQLSLFTNSGNGFIFDHLGDEPSQNPDGGTKEPSVEEDAPTKTSEPKQKPDVTAFINSFRQEGRAMPSAILNLKAMLQTFPELVYLERLPNGDIEVLFERDQLIKALRQEEEKFPQLVFTSFERGLKHAGMEVTQSTHGQITIKRWGMKKGWKAKPPGAKRPRKRKDNGDDDYDESTKKVRRVPQPKDKKPSKSTV